jgi:hypothetical protein
MPDLPMVYVENPMAHFIMNSDGDLFEVYHSCNWCGAVKSVSETTCGRCKKQGWNNAH